MEHNKGKLYACYTLLTFMCSGFSRSLFCPVGLFIPSRTKLRRDIIALPSVRPSVTSLWTLESTSFKWILTKLGTYLVLKRIWSPIQGHRSRSPGQFFRRGDTPRFALPLLYWLLYCFCPSNCSFWYLQTFQESIKGTVQHHWNYDWT